MVMKYKSGNRGFGGIRAHKPIKKTNTCLPKHYAAFDCETEGLYGKAVLICVKFPNNTPDLIFKGDNCVSEFIEEITRHLYRGYYFYAYNLPFDMEKTFGVAFRNEFVNCLDNHHFTMIESNGRIYKAIYHIEGHKTITLLDAMNLTGAGTKLAKLGADLGFPKGVTPKKFITGKPVKTITKEDIKYCLRDCEIILKWLEVIEEMIRPFDMKLKLTAAATAKACWVSMFLKDKGIFVNQKKDERFRESYFGGRTEVFIKRYEKTPLYYYDINSLYPSVMVDNPFPHPDKLRYSDDLYRALETEEGCAKLTVTCPDTLNYPVLPINDSRLIFPTGTFTSTWNFPEIRLAIEKGYTIDKVFWVLSSPPMESPFNEYVAYWREKKIKYSKSGQKALREFAKLMQNSLYGKFAQRVNEEDDIVHIKPDDKTPYRQLTENTWKVMSLKKSRANETIVCWASYVTSYARCALYRFIPDEGIRYCDTDSIVIDKPLPDNLIHATTYGLMSVEDNVIESFYVAPKRYAYNCYRPDEKTGKPILTCIRKLKGVPKDVIKDKAIKTYGGDFPVTYDKPVKNRTALRKKVASYSKETITKNMTTTPLKDKRVFDLNGNSIPKKIMLDGMITMTGGDCYPSRDLVERKRKEGKIILKSLQRGADRVIRN